MEKVIDYARQEFLDLQEGGVDAVMFSNEFSLPYLTKVNPRNDSLHGARHRRIDAADQDPLRRERAVGPLRLYRPGRRHGREVHPRDHVRRVRFGLRPLEHGLRQDLRHRARLGQQNLKLLYNIVPEASAYLGNREVEAIAKSTVFNCRPDVICVSGMTAGVGTDMGVLERVKNAIPETAVFANTGCKVNTIEGILKIADGAVVGTTFKKDGKFENRVDKARVVEFMDKVHAIR